MKSFIFILLIFPILGFSQIQSGVVTYKAKEIKSPLEQLKNKKEDSDPYGVFAKFDKKVKNTLPFIEFKLHFNQMQSSYESKEFMESDNPNLDFDFTLGVLRANGIIYTDISKNLILNPRKYEGKNYLIQKEIEDVNWQIHSETKEILGYQVRKATAIIDLNPVKKGEIIAWFAPSLPFQFGPIGYAKLPGLILELEIHGYAHYATDIQLNEKSAEIKKPTKGKLITEEEYNDEIMKSSFLQLE